MFPLVRPTIATVAVFTFYGSWNEFLWPLVILQNDARYTLPLGLAQLQGQLYGNWFQIAAGSVVMMVPVLLIFFAAQRHFVAGLTAGATKG
jgi:ABC-type glycerol-3-phosphate transport system permease component